MQVLFPTPTEVIVVPERKQLLSGMNVICVNDFPDRKLVQAQTQEAGMVILWQGEEYDNIGQWTDTDVINRIIELYA